MRCNQASLNLAVDTRLEWPQRLSYFTLVVFVVLFAGGGLGVFTIFVDRSRGETEMPLGLGAIPVMMLVVSSYGIRQAGFRWVSLSRRIFTGATDYCAGVQISTGRTTSLVVAMLACLAVGGLLPAITLYVESLSTPGSDDLSGVTFLGTCGTLGLLCMILLIAVRSPAVLQLTPSGVAHLVRRHRGFRVIDVEDFAPWAEIAAITPETLLVSQGPVEFYNSQIRVTYRGSGSSQPDSAEEQDFLIQAHVMVAEPNTLYSLMKHMHEHPEDRELLAGEDAVKLLTPPPLRERFRAAREVKQAEKAKKRAMRSKVRPYA